MVKVFMSFCLWTFGKALNLLSQIPMSNSTTQPTITDLFYYEMLERNVPHQHIGSVFAALSAAKDKARKQVAGLACPRPKGKVNGKVKGTPREMVKAGVKGTADGEANNMGDFRRVDGKVLNRVLKDGSALKKKLLDFHRNVMTDASAKYHFLLTTPSGKVSVESSEDADREWRGRSPLICRRGNGALAVPVREFDEDWANDPDFLECALGFDVQGMKGATGPKQFNGPDAPTAPGSTSGASGRLWGCHAGELGEIPGRDGWET